MDLPLEEEKEAVLAEIREAFAGVSRKDGVSWKESNVLDEYGSMTERLKARDQDTDRSWKEVVANPPWQLSWGSFCFMDAIGVRYYLPAAMTSAVVGAEGTYEVSLEFHLALAKRGGSRKLSLEQWSLLNDRQRCCVARFLAYMVRAELDKTERTTSLSERAQWTAWLNEQGSEWKRALDSYWSQFLP